MKQFRKIDIPDRVVGTFQDNSAEVFDVLTRIPILDGQLVTADLVAGVNEVSHKLGRNYVGWFLVDANDSSIITRVIQGNQPDKYIYVNMAGSPMKATFWVF